MDSVVPLSEDLPTGLDADAEIRLRDIADLTGFGVAGLAFGVDERGDRIHFDEPAAFSWEDE